MTGTVTDLDDERSDREETDPQIKLDRVELRSHRDRLAVLEKMLPEMMDLLRAIARKVGAEVTPPATTG